VLVAVTVAEDAAKTVLVMNVTGFAVLELVSVTGPETAQRTDGSNAPVPETVAVRVYAVAEARAVARWPPTA
jgi:hypothetical protein